MKNTIRVIVVLLAFSGVLAGQAQTNKINPATATNTVITIQQGTNTTVTVLQGTNVQITVNQGLSPVPVVLVTNFPPKPKPPQWVSEAVAALTITRGNSDLTLFTAKITTQKKEPRNEYLFEVDAAYGENEGEDTAETLHGSAQYNHLFSDKFYAFANVDALHDDIQEIRYRVSLNPGIGYYFIKNKTTILNAELGPGIVFEREGDVSTTYASLRAAEHMEQKINAAARVWEKVEIISQANKEDNYYVTAELGMETAITKRFSLQVTLDDGYVNEPATGRKKNDVKLVSGIAYKF